MVENKTEIIKKTSKYPKGHFMGIGIAIRNSIRNAHDNIGIGHVICVAIGAGLGVAIETNVKTLERLEN